MRIVSITPARNESWVLGFSLRAALRWVDHAVVLVHASTDGTLEVACAVQAEHAGRVTIIEESDPVWREMAQRQRLLDTARACGATHVANIDADEVLCGHLFEWIRHQAASLPPGGYMQLPMPQMWDSINEYAVNAPSAHGKFAANWGNSSTMVMFADAPRLYWKAERKDGYDHHHREPYGSRMAAAFRLDGGLMHLQFADRRRLIAKHAAYKITERIRWPHKSVQDIDAMYSLAIMPQRVETKPTPAKWLEAYADIMHHLRIGEVPWQEAWCREQYEQRPEYFKGLNLFGVCEQGAGALS